MFWKDLLWRIKRIPQSVAAWSAKTWMIVAGSTAGALIVAVVVFVVAFQLANRPLVPTVADGEVTEDGKKPANLKDEQKVETQTIKIPSYVSCCLSGDSIAKDLTLYIKGKDDKKITGENFKVKLMDEETADELEAHLNTIYDLDEKIAQKEGKKNESPDPLSDEMVDASLDPNVLYVSAKTGYEITEKERLLLEKQNALNLYKEFLEGLEGTVYEDEDGDGLIRVEQIRSGAYVACLIPEDTYQTTKDLFDAKEYAVGVLVKEQVEYVPIANIEDHAVSAEEAGDVQMTHDDIKIEAVLKDTVEFVESSYAVKPGEYSVSTPAPIEAKVSDKMATQTLGDGTIAINESAEVFSDIASANSVTLTVRSENLTNVRVYSDNSFVKVSGSEESYVISASGMNTGTAVQVIAVGANTDGEEVSVVCTVTVHGSMDIMPDANGNHLYLDAAGSSIATYGNYNASGTYYYESVPSSYIYYGWQTIDGVRYYFDKNANPVSGVQVIGGNRYTFGSNGAMLTSGYGIDVSKWNATIDWTQASSTISFAIVRAGFRGSSGNIAVDPKAGTNITEASRNGVAVGLYVYSMAMNEAQAIEEASLAIDVAKKYGNISLPIYIDMEDECQNPLTTEERDAIVLAFCQTVANAGYSPGVYANKYWLTTQLTPSKYDGLSIWCAQYNTSCTYGGRYDIWQYSSKGEVPGIEGYTDLNISYFQ